VILLDNNKQLFFDTTRNYTAIVVVIRCYSLFSVWLVLLYFGLLPRLLYGLFNNCTVPLIMSSKQNSSSYRQYQHQHQSTSGSSGDAMPLLNLKSSSGSINNNNNNNNNSNNNINNKNEAPTSTSPQHQRESPTDTTAETTSLIGQHVAGYPGGGLQTQPPPPQQYLPPPTYDMNVMAAAWEQFQQQQQQQQQQPQSMSPILYHHQMSPPGHGGPHNNNSNNNLVASLQHPSLQYPYMYNPYAPPPPGGTNTGSGGPIPPPPHLQFYPAPPYGYPMQLTQQQQQPLQPQHQSYPPSYQAGGFRPPRRSNSGSNSGKGGASSSASPKPNEPKFHNVHATSSSGKLPDVSDIFSGVTVGAPGHSYLSPLVDNSGASAGRSGGGYGSIPSFKVYNAPPPASSTSSSSSRRLPPSGRSPTAARTDSGNDLQQQQQQPLQQQKKRKVPFGTSSSTTSTTSIHRRTHSDTHLRGSAHHKRANSSDFLPPSGVSHNRARTLSGGNPLARPTHHHTNSSSSLISQGDASQVSIRSNIAKSSLFAGVDPSSGRVLMHYPYEAIRLVMIPDSTQCQQQQSQQQQQKRNSNTSSNRHYQSIPTTDSQDEDNSQDFSHLTLGHLYADGPVNAASYYEDYVKVSDELEHGAGAPPWESLDANPKLLSNGGQCVCQCANCNSCISKQELLPPDNYLLPVSEDIYRRMLAEVASARNMPCGLFYCGHHEDVAHPSIWIAGTMVMLLFGTLIALAFYTECNNTLECFTA
jgi:hypothetical protein